VLQLREPISETSDKNLAIVTEFVGNGSLADHLSPAECPLRGENRIAKVIVGIALAMRFVHSCGVIHRNLSPHNILLDWNWKVRISDFGHSIPDSNPSKRQESFSSPYFAPECYSNKFSRASDVFSFGLILFELLSGQPAFSKDMTPLQIMCAVVVNDERPEIPKFVIPPPENSSPNAGQRNPKIGRRSKKSWID
jgi:serine/threonine protein kinase